MTTMGVYNSNNHSNNNNNNNNNDDSVLLVRTLKDGGNQKKRGRAQNSSGSDFNGNSKKTSSGNPLPIAVARRNARERNRVKQVNNGFSNLRQHIPLHVAQGYADKGKKLSKVETLRMAVEYIKGLQRLIAEADGVVGSEGTSGSGTSGTPGSGSVDLCSLKTEEEDDEDSSYDLMIEEEQEQQRQLSPENQTRTKSFRDNCNSRSNNRLSENQNRRNRRNSSTNACYQQFPSVNSVTQRQLIFGDEENIEPLPPIKVINNNNDDTSGAILVNSPQFSPVLAQQSPPTRIVILKRDAPCQDFETEIKTTHHHLHHHHQLESPPDTFAAIPLQATLEAAEHSKILVIEDPPGLPITGPQHQTLVENPQTGTHQYVYLTSSPDAGSHVFYDVNGDIKSEETGNEYMEYVGWFEQQEQHGRLAHLGVQRMTHV